jgi:hypothetical protein
LLVVILVVLVHQNGHLKVVYCSTDSLSLPRGTAHVHMGESEREYVNYWVSEWVSERLGDWVSE